MADPVRWGILAPGGIANQFAKGLAVLPDAELVAVGSRAKERADAFADEYDIPNRHGSYKDLAADPDVDAVYVATPHPFHKDNTVMCLEAGKHVLCEKPMGINASDVEEMIACARKEKRFLMEAMWTRFLPAVVKLREILASGAVGEVRMLTMDFGFRGGWAPERRWLNLELGGGALLDVGVYDMAFMFMVFGGAPEEIRALGHLGETGADEQTAVIARYPEGQLAVLSCAVRTSTPMITRIDGTEGRIDVASPSWHPTTFTVTKAGEEPETVELPYEATGYNCEAQEVMDRIRAGDLESEIMPLDESLAIARAMDAVREQIGLAYPMESSAERILP